MRPTSVLVSLAALVGAGRLSAQDTFPAVDRVVAVGDVHGDFNQLVTVLRDAGLIDGKNRWIGGKAHLVQTGDVLDRGPDSRKVMELLMELESQAAKAGGQVHALIGNHEAMNLLGDLRYVSAGEYDSYKGPTAEKLRERAFLALGDTTRKNDAGYRKQWDAEHPLGWVEQRLAFEGNGRYGTWIRGHNAAIRIGDYLFLHGGIGPKYLASSLEAINQGIRAGLEKPGSNPMAEDPEGPLWYRGLATEDAAKVPLVDSVLAAFGVKHVVIGHTVTPGTVIPLYFGKVIMIDVGMSASYGGPPASLVIENGVPSTIHRGKKLPLPTDGELVPYLKAAAALDPAPSRLEKLIARLDGAAAPR